MFPVVGEAEEIKTYGPRIDKLPVEALKEKVMAGNDNAS